MPLNSRSLTALPRDPASASAALVRMDSEVAAELFRALPFDAQLAIVEATPDPYDREEIYYLLPDCTELVQRSRVETVLEVVNANFGTGLACGILSAVTPEQFAEMFARTVQQDGIIDQDTVTLWIAELTELEPDELTNLLTNVPVELLVEIFRGRIDVHGRYKGMAIDSGMVGLEHIEFGDNEQARLMGELVWAADPELMIAALRELLTERDEGDAAPEDGMDAEDGDAKPADSDDLAEFDLNRVDELLPPPAKPR